MKKRPAWQGLLDQPLTGADVGAVESELAAKPPEAQTRDRLVLIGHYQRSCDFKKCNAHIKWLIENQPDAAVAQINNILFPDDYRHGYELWRQKLRSMTPSTTALENAAAYMMAEGLDEAAGLVDDALRLEPGDPHLLRSSGFLYELRWYRSTSSDDAESAAKSALGAYRAAYAVVADSETRLCIGKNASRAGFHDESASIAKEIIASNQDYQLTNIGRQRVHFAYAMLGGGAMRLPTVNEAVACLEMMKTDAGFPASGILGPDFSLASALASRGEIGPVREYLLYLRMHWERHEDLSRWLSLLDQGNVPLFRIDETTVG